MLLLSQITIITTITLRMSSIAENNFNSVERIDEYGHLPSEAAAEIEGSAPAGWPSSGAVAFKDVRMRCDCLRVCPRATRGLGPVAMLLPARSVSVCLCVVTWVLGRMVSSSPSMMDGRGGVGCVSHACLSLACAGTGRGCLSC